MNMDSDKNKFRFPRKNTVDSIEISDCDEGNVFDTKDIASIYENPILKNYSKMYEGKDCSLKIGKKGKTLLKHYEKKGDLIDGVQIGKVFCNAMSPLLEKVITDNEGNKIDINTLNRKQLETLIKKTQNISEQKIGFYVDHEYWKSNPKKQNPDTCYVGLQVKTNGITKSLLLKTTDVSMYSKRKFEK